MTPPSLLLDQLPPHISEVIINKWGSLGCNLYISKLFSNDSRKQRNGFPLHVASALLELNLLNTAILEEAGNRFEDSAFEESIWQNSMWELPKNF